MEIKDYKGNSNALKEKKVEKVVTNPIKTKKKGEFQKFTEAFISDDAPNVKSYLLIDVLVPIIKDAIVDAVTDGIRMIFYGESGGGRRRASSTGSSVNNASYVRYSRQDDDRKSQQRRSKDRSRSVYDYDDIILSDRGEAEDVLDRLQEIISVYNMASVGDLYDLVGINDVDYTANDYGWTDLRGASILRTRQGYLLKLPRAYALDL